MLYACVIVLIMTNDSERKMLEFERKCYRKTKQIRWSLTVVKEEL